MNEVEKRKFQDPFLAGEITIHLILQAMAAIETNATQSALIIKLNLKGLFKHFMI
ncbi:MAG TPA: hypothetical protein VGP55_01230 [Chitinophagaceae bacterium]|nr:hypothetical protein [Chitinophagaceae bacterium]